MTDPYGNVVACATSSVGVVGTVSFTTCGGDKTTLTAAPTPTSDYDPGLAGSACEGYSATFDGGPNDTPITCPPSAYDWTVYTPNWGAPNSENFPMDTCGAGFLDNLRGRCGVITNWGCEKGGTDDRDTKHTFATVIE